MRPGMAKRSHRHLLGRDVSIHKLKTYVRPADDGRRELTGASLLLGVASVFLLLLVSYRCGQGFDFSDEGLYLIWISRPWIYDTSFTQFGYVYWPLYEILRGSIAGLRQVNLILTLVLAAASLWVLVRNFELPTATWQAACLVLALSCATLTGNHQWLPTPNYNSLNLQGLLIAVLGMVLICQPTSDRQEIAGAILLGLGGWLCWTAKPTTALVLAPLTLVFIVLVAKRRWRTAGCAAAVAIALCVASMLVLDGASVENHMARYQRALNFASLLGSDHTFSGMLANSHLLWKPIERNVFWLLAVLSAFVSALAVDAYSRRAMCIRTAVYATGAAVAFTMVLSTSFATLQRTSFQALWVAAPALGAVISIALRQGRWPFAEGTRSFRIFALTLVPFPLAYSLGGGGNIWVQAADAYVLWVIAAVAVVIQSTASGEARQVLSILAASVLGLAALLVGIGLEEPYRQPEAVRLQMHTTTLGARGATLELDAASANYITTLRTSAYAQGFVFETPVIDLTGRHPGTVFAIGGDAPGTAWLISGYPGSDALAVANLDRVACDALAKSWILMTPDGKLSLPADLLSRYGINIKIGYSEVARLPSPTAYGTHVLLKPMRQAAEAAAACEQMRKGNS
jgi:hypothetical protein